MILMAVVILVVVGAVASVIGGGFGAFFVVILNRFGRRGEYWLTLAANIVGSLIFLVAIPYAIFYTVDNKAYLKACLLLLGGTYLGVTQKRDWRRWAAVRAALHAENADIVCETYDGS